MNWHRAGPATVQPQDDFRTDLIVAQDLLRDEDPVQQLKGVKFIETLQRRHQNDATKYYDLTITLAEHYRNQQSYQLANNNMLIY